MNKKEFLEQARAKYKAMTENVVKGIDWVSEMNILFSEELILRVWLDVDSSKIMHRWCSLDTLPIQKNYEIEKCMGQYLAGDNGNFPEIIKALKKALINTPDSMVESVEFETEDGEKESISVWEPLEGRYNVKEFCEFVGINLKDK